LVIEKTVQTSMVSYYPIFPRKSKVKMADCGLTY